MAKRSFTADLVGYRRVKGFNKSKLEQALAALQAV
jgi:hypothetical protein